MSTAGTKSELHEEGLVLSALPSSSRLFTELHKRAALVSTGKLLDCVYGTVLFVLA